jgi:hypothetical protein
LTFSCDYDYVKIKQYPKCKWLVLTTRESWKLNIEKEGRVYEESRRDVSCLFWKFNFDRGKKKGPERIHV